MRVENPRGISLAPVNGKGYVTIGGHWDCDWMFLLRIINLNYSGGNIPVVWAEAFWQGPIYGLCSHQELGTK